MAARKLITIEGEQRLYTEGEWVVYDSQNRPDGCMHADAASGDDPVKAAREFWGGSTEAMKHLIKGYRIELMTWERCKREILPQLAAPSSPSSEGEGLPPLDQSTPDGARGVAYGVGEIAATEPPPELAELRRTLRERHDAHLATLSSPQGSGESRG